MKRAYALVLLVVLGASGCACSVPAKVANGVEVLKDNTLKLGGEYGALLNRAGPPAITAGPADETPEALVERKAKHEKAWAKHLKHRKALIKANNLLAERTHKWAQTCKKEN